MTGVSLLTAFLGGLLSLVSPCAALLLPSFFAYAFTSVGTLLSRTAAFLAGLLVVLVPLGAGVAAIGELLTRYRDIATTAGGALLVLFGLMTILGLGFGSAAAGRISGRLRISGTVSVFALGTVYGLAGFCSGPLLGGILTVAAVGAQPLYGAALLGVYAVGMAAPLFLLALLWDRFDLSSRRWLRGRELRIGPLRTQSTSLLSGLLFLAVGILFLATDGTAAVGGALGVDQQFEAQQAIQHTLGPIPDVVVALVLVVVVLSAILLRRAVRQRSRGGVLRKPLSQR
ncbi:cytochrome c biogenesis CcdA family protein [Amycolatopsis sp. NPDC058340]|uniref:cytochrome c biogenesis CcdA family protein n=1 Tax=Amycolatopsis sp. NPDC058340 TaxID=3346453 RepID=UPI003650DE52